MFMRANSNCAHQVRPPFGPLHGSAMRRPGAFQLPREPECHAERRAQEAVVVEVEAVALVLVDECQEIPHVPSQGHAIVK